ncbi:hypothetical protein BJY24_003915 [Nocardia transvalensis]|uniref:Uncharacterized protein n=1 Tax=Nocardia transvalensis TaxID=37333 RepID=A0A7W9UJ42_9NOCA|nr:hypothetical protein [Nocardia transvalensis]MBB5915048.1 hypothetical protein [Nocardia transvalensis]
MIDWPVFVVIAAAVVSVTMVMVGVAHLRTTRRPVAVPANGIRCPDAERNDAAGRRPDAWLSDWTHAAPQREFTVTQAHATMQQHRTCGIDNCARKAAAFATLVEQGRMKPDSSRRV